jgi:predicted nucleic acid-binding protein
MSIITNTTVLSNFAAIGQLDLLRRLYGTVHITPEVYEEVQAGLEEGYDFYAGLDRLIHPFVKGGWLRLTTMTEEELQLSRELPRRLHYGEVSCLVIGQERGWQVLTDDQAARRTAKQRGIAVSGSVGCLVLAVKRGLCSLGQANAWLQQMIAQGYRSPVTDLTPLMGEASASR